MAEEMTFEQRQQRQLIADLTAGLEAALPFITQIVDGDVARRECDQLIALGVRLVWRGKDALKENV